MFVVSFCFFPHSNWKNNCFLFLVAIPAASQSTELLSVGSCLVQGVLFPGGVGITDGGCVCSCCLMLTALRVFKSPVFLLVQGGRSLFRGCCSAWNLHGSAGRAVTVKWLWLCHWPNTQMHTYQSCSFLDRRLFLGSMREHHLPMPMDWAHRSTLLGAACHSLHHCLYRTSFWRAVCASNNSNKEEISFLFFTFYFLF